MTQSAWRRPEVSFRCRTRLLTNKQVKEAQGPTGDRVDKCASAELLIINKWAAIPSRGQLPKYNGGGGSGIGNSLRIQLPTEVRLNECASGRHTARAAPRHKESTFGTVNDNRYETT